MRTVAIIQARVGSTRLPGKVLLDIGGESMLARVVRRTRRAKELTAVVVATSTLPADEPIVAECARLEVPVFRGSEADVLDRYYRAALAFEADAVVRITSDCPLVDPAVIDQVVSAFLAKRPDYASNTLQRSFPRGLDVEVMSSEALATAWREALAPEERVHVTPFLYRHPVRFGLLNVPAPADFSAMRWTVDTAEDLEFVRDLDRELEGRDDLGWQEVAAFVGRSPHLAEVNRRVPQKPLSEL